MRADVEVGQRCRAGATQAPVADKGVAGEEGGWPRQVLTAKEGRRQRLVQCVEIAEAGRDLCVDSTRVDFIRLVPAAGP